MNQSLNASTNPMQGTGQNPMETEVERLRRLTKIALDTGKPNKYGPKQKPPGEDPEEVIKRAMHAATKPK